MLWLKKCVVSTFPYEIISVDVYLVVLLAHGRNLALAQAMTSYLQSGLRVLTDNFC